MYIRRSSYFLFILTEMHNWVTPLTLLYYWLCQAHNYQILYVFQWEKLKSTCVDITHKIYWNKSFKINWAFRFSHVFQNSLNIQGASLQLSPSFYCSKDLGGHSWSHGSAMMCTTQFSIKRSLFLSWKCCLHCCIVIYWFIKFDRKWPQFCVFW